MSNEVHWKGCALSATGLHLTAAHTPHTPPKTNSIKSTWSETEATLANNPPATHHSTKVCKYTHNGESWTVTTTINYTVQKTNKL